MKARLVLAVILAVACLLFPASVCHDVALAETPEPPPKDTGESEEIPSTPTAIVKEVILARTPEPTATPGPLAREVSRRVAAAGLARATFLGVTLADWINLGLSLLFVLAGYLAGTLLIHRLLPPLVQRTETDFDDRLLASAGPNLRWLVVILTLDWGTTRLTFLSAQLKSFLHDVYYVIALLIGARLVWQLVDLAEEWYSQRARRAGRGDELAPLITLLVRVGQVVIVVTAIAVLLSYFGINVTAFAAALGIGGLAISLAAQDTISDAISGFIILVDQPFRVGDRIEIQEVGTWGDVVEIGLRTTRIRTRDNRMVIVPNSTIGTNQVINYTFPDPKYRIETYVGIAYGTDVEAARRVIIDAVRQVQGVLPDRPVDALYDEMGASAMTFRVRWWIESYADTRWMFDQVHTALQEALDAAGIESPFPTQTLNIQVDSKGSDQSTASRDRP